LVGVVPVAVNTLLTTKDYEFMLQDSRAHGLVVSEALWPQFADILHNAAAVQPWSSALELDVANMSQ
jgi:benzoate-CoA ligase